MPIVNASPPKYRIWICKPDQDEVNGLEITHYCSGKNSGYLTLTSEPLNDSGLILASGELVLVVPPFDKPIAGAYDFTFDPWESDWWNEGNYVLVKVADRSGILRETPINRLAIISKPEPPGPGNWVLSLELGCVMRLNDGVKASAAATNGSRSTAISELMSRINVNTAGSTPGKALVNYQPSNTSLVTLAGELALGGYSALYANRGGTVTLTRINFKPEKRLFKHVVGTHDAGDFKLLQNTLRAASEVEVVSTESAVEDGSGGGGGGNGDNGSNPSDRQKYNGSFSAVQQLSRAAIVEGESAEEIDAVWRKESWQWAGALYKSNVEEQRVRGLIVPEDLYLFVIKQGRDLVYPGPFGRFNALVSQRTKHYEGGSQGRLLKDTTKTYKCLGEVLAEWYKRNLTLDRTLPGFLDPFEAEKTIITYDYKKFDLDQEGEDAKGQTRKIHKVKWLPKGQVAASANDWIQPGGTLAANPTDLTPAEVEIQTWRKRSKDEWEYTVQHYQAGRAKSGTVQAFLRLIKVEPSETQVSRNGEIRPPAAERRPGKRGSSSVGLSQPIRGRVKLAGKTVNRDRTIEVNHLEDEHQAEQIAEILALLDEYRQQGFRITTSLLEREEWLSWKPLTRIDLDYKGFTYWGLTDLVSFTFAANQAVVVADCMKIGRQPAEDTYPYPALSPLNLNDPDPEPFPEPPITELRPERLNRQPFIDAAQVIYKRSSTSETSGVFKLGYNSEPISPFVSQSEAGLLVLEAFTTQTETSGVFELIPWFYGDTRSQSVVAEVNGDGSLLAYWKLDSTTWADQQASHNDLSENGAVNLVYDAEEDGYCPEFGHYLNIVDGGGYYYDAGGDSGYLGCNGENFDVQPDNGRWSWKVSFDLYVTPRQALLDSSTGETGIDPYFVLSGTIFKLENQIEIYTTDVQEDFANTGRVTVSFNCYHLDETEQQDTASPVELQPDTWYAVECEFDAATLTRTVRVNGTATTDSNLLPWNVGEDYYPQENGYSSWHPLGQYTPGNLIMGGSEVNNCRIKEFKFFKLEFIPRPMPP